MRGSAPDTHLELAGVNGIQPSDGNEVLDVVGEHHVRLDEPRGAIENRLIGAVHKSDRTLLKEMVTQQFLSCDS